MVTRGGVVPNRDNRGAWILSTLPLMSRGSSWVSRRVLLAGATTGAVAAVARAGPTPAPGPTIVVPKRRRLRVLGTHVTLQEPLRQQAQRDLGIEIEFSPGGSAAVLHQASTRPESFDLYEQWSNSIRVLWGAGAIQPIECARLDYWKDINALTKEGRLTEGAPRGRGDAPSELLYTQRDGTLSANETSTISFLPYVHNVDSFGYDASSIEAGVPYETESWAWLFDPRFAGRTALVNAPTIGLFDAALAAEASGLMTFGDIGAITRDELDELTAHLIELRRAGQFRGLWSSVPQSVDFMQRDGVAIESMFSPAVAMLRGAGTPCLYAAPKEGYRAWHGVMCLSSAARNDTKDAAYAYMNWWLSGWPGAFIARQGYYISTPQHSRKLLSPAEWDYWYAGKPATEALTNPAGEIAVQKGDLRRGGSYENRFAHIAVWNSVMPTYEYSLVKWNEFLLS